MFSPRFSRGLTEGKAKVVVKHVFMLTNGASQHRCEDVTRHL